MKSNLPRHILLVTRSLPFHRTGGMEAVAWDLARALVREGCKVSVLTTASINLPARSVVDGVEIHALAVPSGRYSMRWWWAARRTYFKEYRHSVDVVLSVSAGALSFVSRAHAGRPLFVAQIHGTAWGELRSKLRQRSIWAGIKAIRNAAWMFRDLRYRYFDSFVAVGPAVENDMACFPTRSIMGEAQRHTISNGIDPASFAFDLAARKRTRDLLEIGEDSSVLISASRLHSQKGVVEGLKAFAAASRKNPTLYYVIVGDGPDEGRLREMAASLGVATRVRFTGKIPRAQLRDYLSAADAFLFSTIRVEGLPLNVLEALASGLPVIASHSVADDRLEMMAVDPADVEGMASAILSATCCPPGDRSSLLPEEFTLSASALAYLSLFSRLQADIRSKDALRPV